MAKIYTKNTWTDEVLASDERYNILDNGGSILYSSTQLVLATSVTQAGTAVDATKMNNLENGVDGLDTLVDAHSTEFINRAIAHTCEGRLTLSSGVPVTLADVTAAGTLYFTPYVGNVIALYSGTRWVVRASAEISISLSGKTASKNYDVFCYDSSGTPTLELLVWTNDTTRATALAYQDGVLVKSGAPTRRYLGTIRTTATTGQCEDTETRRLVWNMYNRVPRPMYRTAGTSHTYDSATYRQWNADASVILEFVMGQTGEVRGGISVSISTTTGTSIRTVCCLDDLSAATGATYRRLGACGITGANIAIFAADSGQVLVGAGYHYLNPEEASSATATNTFTTLYLRGDILG